MTTHIPTHAGPGLPPTHCSPGCRVGEDCAACMNAIRREAVKAWHRWNEADDLRVVEG